MDKKVYIGYVVGDFLLDENNQQTINIKVRVPLLHGLTHLSGIANDALPIATPLSDYLDIITQEELYEKVIVRGRVFVIFLDDAQTIARYLALDNLNYLSSDFGIENITKEVVDIIVANDNNSIIIIYKDDTEKTLDISGLSFITDKALQTHIHSYNDLTDRPILFSGSYLDLINIPATFTPTIHNHDDLYAGINHNHNDLYASNDHIHSYNDLTDKPSTFTPSAHNHNNLYYQKTDTYSKTEIDNKLGDIETALNTILGV